MSAIDDVFERLRANGRKAFMPFITAGDPDLDFTLDVIREMSAADATSVNWVFRTATLLLTVQLSRLRILVRSTSI